MILYINFEKKMWFIIWFFKNPTKIIKKKNSKRLKFYLLKEQNRYLSKYEMACPFLANKFSWKMLNVIQTSEFNFNLICI